MLGQVMMDALTSKKSYGAAERHKEALQDVEEYFGVTGLLDGFATVSYKRHNTRVREAVQAAAAVQNTGRPTRLHKQLLLGMRASSALYRDQPLAP